MDISLRSAFIISVIIHIGIFAPFYGQHLLRQDIEKKNTVMVDYVILKEITEAMAANKEIVLKKPETPRIDIQKEVKADDRKSSEAGELKEKALPRKRDAAKDPAKESAKARSQQKQEEDYINYYQLVREKIRSRLKNNYQHYKREGDVYLSFTLTQNGSLLTYSIDREKSTQDETLLNITAASLKAISPFPALPRSLSTSKMSFNIIISFRK
jgi:outer membrane biosynthesis protein TonB